LGNEAGDIRYQLSPWRDVSNKQRYLPCIRRYSFFIDFRGHYNYVLITETQINYRLRENKMGLENDGRGSLAALPMMATTSSGLDGLDRPTGSAVRGSPTLVALQTRDIAIRRPAGRDISGLAALFSELQRHYQCPVTDEQAVAAATLACRPRRAMFDPHVLIATADAEIVGSIVLNVTFPAFELSRALYVRDLYVAASMRQHGIGQALVRAAAHLSNVKGYSALDLTTLTDNTIARQMYQSCGARVLPRTYYRLQREDLGQ
jgi:ribosomal protein S18 acetylase RimI-like enzyme